MNHRVLFFLSVTVIVIGLAGIFIQGRHADDVGAPQTVSTGVKTKSITIAETLRDLKPHDIIEVKDYRLRTIEVAQDSQDERDIAAMGSSDLNGFLVRNHIAKHSAIVAKAVESPLSKTFLLHSLKKMNCLMAIWFALRRSICSPHCPLATRLPCISGLPRLIKAAMQKPVRQRRTA
ncbi:Uncharacterised protein [Serratia rubidaea]|uniref:Flp pilus assembly protein CpaB n=1 Tax=Serratia rubidaea TaxID=61652 RepID=A0A447QNJ9_SERRU|nr:Uncharacterised protein [Serratia rubidaea]